VAEDGDDARRVREFRHLGEQPGLDVFPREQNIRRLQAGVEPFLEEILPLDREQPQLVPPAPVMELADELEPLVVAGGDQAS
jgi:hypothetical protein